MLVLVCISDNGRQPLGLFAMTLVENGTATIPTCVNFPLSFSTPFLICKDSSEHFRIQPDVMESGSDNVVSSAYLSLVPNSFELEFL